MPPNFSSRDKDIQLNQNSAYQAVLRSFMLKRISPGSFVRTVCHRDILRICSKFHWDLQKLLPTFPLKRDHCMTEQFGLGGFKDHLIPLSQAVPSPIQKWPGTRDPFKTRNSQLGRSHLRVLRNKCLGLKLTAKQGEQLQRLSSTFLQHGVSVSNHSHGQELQNLMQTTAKNSS